MGFFHRKKKAESTQPVEIPVLPHEHVWKDMPWYMEVEYNGSHKTASYAIIEPYICVTCGARENKTLERETWQNIDSSTRDEYYAKIHKKYRKYLRPRAVVEDMINNILMVKDPEYLDMIEVMRGLPHRRCGTSAEMQRDNNQPKINLLDEEKKNKN